MTPPLVSVVMCVQNSQPYISDAVESILQQSFRDFEFIIVDDHSTDGTLDYLRSLKDPRVRVFQAKTHGQTPGLNQGLREAQGDWVARMDGDDWSFPNRIVQQWNAATRDLKIVLVSADYVVCDETFQETIPVTLSSNTDHLIAYLSRKNNPFCHPVMMFRREAALSAGGYDERIKNAQDYRLWLELLKRGRLVHVPELLLKYRVRRGSLSILRQPEQTTERQQILGGRVPTGSPGRSARFANARAVEGMYEYRLAFAAWCAGQRDSCWRHALSALCRWTRPGRTLGLMISSFLPAKWYLRLSGYARVFKPTAAESST